MQYSKDNFGTKLLAFAGDKGFYIILILCAIAIGISGYVLFFTGNGSKNDTGNLEPNLTAADDSGSSTVIPPVSVTIEGETPNETDASVSGQADGVVKPSEEAPKIPSKSSTSANKPAQAASNPVNVSKAVYVLRWKGKYCVLSPATIWFLTQLWATGAYTPELISLPKRGHRCMQLPTAPSNRYIPMSLMAIVLLLPMQTALSVTISASLPILP